MKVNFNWYSPSFGVNYFHDESEKIVGKVKKSAYESFWYGYVGGKELGSYVTEGGAKRAVEKYYFNQEG